MQQTVVFLQKIGRLNKFCIKFFDSFIENFARKINLLLHYIHKQLFTFREKILVNTYFKETIYVMKLGFLSRTKKKVLEKLLSLF